MRVTQRSMTANSLAGLNSNLSAVAKLQNQLTSGKVINRPSDSPTGANTAMQARSALGAVAQQARNITDAQSWLDNTYSTMTNMINVTQQARSLTVQGLNTGATSADAATAISKQVSALRDSLVGMANTTVGGRPLFGGVTAGSTAYDTTGKYVGVLDSNGDPVPVTRRISDAESIRIDVTGPEAFGQAPEDVFSVLENIAAHVAGSTADPVALADDLTALDGALQKMLVGVAGISAKAARVETAGVLNQDRSLSLTTRLADVEDVDLAKTTMELQMQQVTYQAALSVTSKTLQQSLVDFLR
jgi:flagellar hook-associated protein 3 FlgL